MVKALLIYKNSLIKIKKSFGRYISIFLIVFIGVGFFAGLQASSPDIRTVACDYYNEYNLMDFKIVSSMGLTQSDVVALSNADDVEKAIGSYSLDVLEEDKTIRVHALEKDVNNVKLLKGNMPKNDDECVADSRHYKLGDKIKINRDKKDFKNTEFIVTGLVDSVLYVEADYGTTTVGDGKLSSYIFINKDNFKLDAYTEVYLLMKNSNQMTGYGDEYKGKSDSLNNILVGMKPEREEARSKEIHDGAYEKIEKNEKKLNDKKEEGEEQLANAKIELDNGSQKIKDGKSQLAENEAKLNKSVKKQEKKFSKARTKINNAWEKIDSALKEYGLKRSEVASTIKKLDASIKAMKEQLKNLTPGTQEYIALSTKISQSEAQYNGLTTLKTSMDKLITEEQKLNDGITTFNNKIEKSRAEIQNAKNELKENEQQISDGYEEYEDNLKKFETEIKDAEDKIAEAKEDLADLEHPKWTILGREASAGYMELETDTGVIDSIAKVFPLFFILIVALMTSNNMARMIDEERSEIGTLTSLGYKDQQIIKPYLLYVLSASILGAATGFIAGCRILPPLIYVNFDTIMPPLVIQYDLFIFAIILIVTIALMSAVTIWGCHRKLRHEPAKLLRPKPPRKGQRIILQHIGFIWNHLSFTWKVTMRNMFRFKKRALMTIIGVAGCAALLLVGFGLQDGMNGVVEKQYGNILKYDNMMILKDETMEVDSDLRKIFKEKNVKNPLLLSQTSVTHEDENTSLDIYVIVPEKVDANFTDYFALREEKSGAPLSIEENSVIISQKISEAFNIHPGDTLSIKDADNEEYQVTVTDIAENYISNYIYMDKDTYKQVFGEDVGYNTIVSKYKGDETPLAEAVMDSELVVNITFTNDIIKKALDSNAQLDSIIILLVVVASLLAFIVLYNLTAINISERTREIATLKVLGFREYETNAYIYREAGVLAVISVMLGMIGGFFLHGYVLDVIEGTTRVLSRKIEWSSYGASAALTLIFAMVMQVITYFKLKTVDMIQSLKSVE